MNEGNAIQHVLRPFEGRQLVEITYQGRRGWLLPQLEAAMEYTPTKLGALMRSEWAAEFRAGEDFVVVRGDELRALREALAATLSRGVAEKTRHITLVYESGLHRIAVLSGKPAGVKLRDFLCREVLPQLARTGTYAPSGLAVGDLARLESLVGSVVALVTDSQRMLAENTRWLMQRMDRLESDATHGTIGALVAEDEIKRPLRGYCARMADLDGAEGAARTARLRSYSKQAHGRVRRAAQFSLGLGHPWARLPTQDLTRARAEVDALLAEVRRRESAARPESQQRLSLVAGEVVRQ